MSAALPFHPLADAFPLMEGAQFDELVASIKANGLRHPIVTLDGMILDGRNRYRACQTLKIQASLQPFSGSDPIAFVLDENLHRRHLNESQRGLIAAKLVSLSAGENQHTLVTYPYVTTRKQAAKLLGVSEPTVTNARTVLTQGTPKQIEQIQRGEAGARTLAQDIRRQKKGLPRMNKNTDRFQQRRLRGQLWGQLRDALNNLSGLPLPTDVLAIVRENDKTKTVETKLPIALSWLKEFEHAWRNRDQAAA